MSREEGTVSAKARAQLDGATSGTTGWGWGCQEGPAGGLGRVWLQFGGLNSVHGLRLDHSHCRGWCGGH